MELFGSIWVRYLWQGLEVNTNIFQLKMKIRLIYILTFLINSNSFSQNTFNCTPDEFNSFVLKEVNKHRKKVKVSPLYNDALLSPAGVDHSNYMAKKDKFTHFQKGKIKKTPKNRVDYYGEQFKIVGENVLQNWLTIPKKHDIKTCEDLAKVLVESWRNSPPHYKNMISKDYTTTYTSFNISSKGKIYACQLFGSDAYLNPYKDSLLNYKYKPTNDFRCRRCETKLLAGELSVINDSLIMYNAVLPLLSFRTKHTLRRPRFNLFHFGIATDIVLKEQYNCDTNIVFNGKTGVRGIPLEPVFKKNFRKGKNVFFWKFISIELGVVPSWIKQDYEVNLTAINNKRTCMPIIYNVLPTGFHVDIYLDLYLDSLGKNYLEQIDDSLKFRLDFKKSISDVNDTSLLPLDNFVNNNKKNIKSIEIKGNSSIEGSTEDNINLYQKRAGVITTRLIELGIDSSSISISSEENFKEFRRDITNTKYAFLLSNSDLEIKTEVNNKYSEELEYILANHRYAEVVIRTLRYEKKSFEKDTVYKLFKKYLLNNDIKKCKKIQAIEYGLLLNNEISLNDVNNFKIQFKKENVDILCDRYLMKYHIDTSNANRLSEFVDSLNSLLKIDPKNTKVNTNLVILKYQEWISSPYKKSRKYYDTLINNRNIDPIIKSRMILNYATTLDWWTYFRPFTPKKFLYNSIKKDIKSAKLDISDYFELASYYAFFENYNFAYLLTKKLDFREASFQETVFFLKLIFYLDKSLAKKTILKHFHQIAQMKGNEFCKYFNSPNLNFQILDDEDIRKIYCQTCSY